MNWNASVVPWPESVATFLGYRFLLQVQRCVSEKAGEVHGEYNYFVRYRLKIIYFILFKIKYPNACEKTIIEMLKIPLSG